MDASTSLLLLDLTGTFAFGLNGALTALRVTHLDIVGVLAVGMTTALGGGIIRDILLGDLPPATFRDGRYLAVAAAGALIAFAFAQHLDRLAGPIEVFDALGLSIFAVVGASKGMTFDFGPAQAIILGAITAVGGGTVRDIMVGRVPSVMREGLYAIPAMVAAGITVASIATDLYGWAAALVAGAACFVIRLLSVHLQIDAPRPPGVRDRSDPPDRT